MVWWLSVTGVPMEYGIRRSSMATFKWYYYCTFNTCCRKERDIPNRTQLKRLAMQCPIIVCRSCADATQGDMERIAQDSLSSSSTKRTNTLLGTTAIPANC